MPAAVPALDEFSAVVRGGILDGNGDGSSREESAQGPLHLRPRHPLTPRPVFELTTLDPGTGSIPNLPWSPLAFVTGPALELKPNPKVS